MIFNTSTYTYKKRESFLQNLANTCNVSRSCRMAGVDRSDMYKLRKSDPFFSDDWARALEIGLDALEDEMIRRAFEGVVITNQYRTNCGYSDVLAMFLLKAYRPDKYSDRFRSTISRAENITLDLDDPRIANKMDRILRSLMVSAQNSPSRKVSTELQ